MSQLLSALAVASPIALTAGLTLLGGWLLQVYAIPRRQQAREDRVWRRDQLVPLFADIFTHVNKARADVRKATSRRYDAAPSFQVPDEPVVTPTQIDARLAILGVVEVESAWRDFRQAYDKFRVVWGYRRENLQARWDEYGSGTDPDMLEEFHRDFPVDLDHTDSAVVGCREAWAHLEATMRKAASAFNQPYR